MSYNATDWAHTSWATHLLPPSPIKPLAPWLQRQQLGTLTALSLSELLSVVSTTLTVTELEDADILLSLDLILFTIAEQKVRFPSECSTRLSIDSLSHDRLGKFDGPLGTNKHFFDPSEGRFCKAPISYVYPEIEVALDIDEDLELTEDWFELATQLQSPKPASVLEEMRTASCSEEVKGGGFWELVVGFFSGGWLFSGW